MSLSVLAAVAYGILALIGGVAGYTRVRSKPSLIAGVVSGLVLIFSGVAYAQGADWGRIVALIVTFLLIDVFAWRLIKTRKFMPSGIMIIAGVAAFIAMLQG
jgi:uncharacterized membrane protein (UPF0136 family)